MFLSRVLNIGSIFIINFNKVWRLNYYENYQNQDFSPSFDKNSNPYNNNWNLWVNTVELNIGSKDTHEIQGFSIGINVTSL